MPIIEVIDLSKSFYVRKKSSFFKTKKQTIQAINSVNFSIYEGERVGLIGTNGAGKSTMIKIMTGVISPTLGKVLINDQYPSIRNNKFLKKIGVLFGNSSSLWNELTLQRNFSLLKVIFSLSDDEFTISFNNLVKEFNLDNLLQRTIKNLSLGQRMKCEVAACLLHKPQILFLDEPSIGLDINAKYIMRDIILGYAKRNNITVVLTSHDISDIEKICDRLIILNKGNIIVDDTIESIKQKYISYKDIIVLSEEEYFKWDEKHTNIIDSSPYRTVIRVNINKVSIKKIISKLLDYINVQDINIHNPSLEDILKEIYLKN